MIKKGIHNARLQGPAPNTKSNKNTIPFVTTYMSNFDIKPITSNIRTLISNKKLKTLEHVLKDVNVVVGYKQPPNIRNILTRAKFSDSTPANKFATTPGIFKTCDSRCNICHKNYLQECSTFETSSGEMWEIKCKITCNTKNVIYYLKCNMCNGEVTYTGKTKTKLRQRTNNHISCCRSGKGTNIFDAHVFNCGTKNKSLEPPYFQLYAFMLLSTEEKLLVYEKHLHRKGYDTMNR